MGPLLAILLLVACDGREACDAKEEDGVLVLDKFNFKCTIQREQNPGLIVEFYAPWCGHCRQLAPEYTAAAAILQKEKPSVRLAKVDATRNKALGRKFAPQGYPTLHIFRGDPSQFEEFDGMPNSTTIVHWARKTLGQACQHITTADAAQQFVSQLREMSVSGGNSNAVIGYAGAKGAAAEVTMRENVLQQAASGKSWLDVHCGIIRGKKSQEIFAAVTQEAGEIKTTVATKAEGTEAMPGLILLGSENGTVSIFDETYGNSHWQSPAQLDLWMKGRRIPLVISFKETDSSTRKAMEKMKVHSILFVDVTNKHPYHDLLLSTFEKLAQRFRGQAAHVVVPSTEGGMCGFFGLSANPGEGMSSAMFPAHRFLNVSKNGQHKQFNGADLLSQTEGNNQVMFKAMLEAEQRHFGISPTMIATTTTPPADDGETISEKQDTKADGLILDEEDDKKVDDETNTPAVIDDGTSQGSAVSKKALKQALLQLLEDDNGSLMDRLAHLYSKHAK